MNKEICGNCKWWEQSDPIRIGDCMKSGPFIIPASLRVKDRIEMYENEGAYCPCYESREKSQPEGRDCIDCGSFVPFGDHCSECGLGKDLI